MRSVRATFIHALKISSQTYNEHLEKSVLMRLLADVTKQAASFAKSTVTSLRIFFDTQSAPPTWPFSAR